MKKVSIIVPVYNVAEYLENCVQSILGQTHQNLEVILVDDGSKDNSGLLCDQLALKDSRILVIHQENKGVSAARNAGVKIASGEYIGFVDPDDWLEPTMYEVLVGLMEKDCTDAAFCGYWENFENRNFQTIEHSPKLDGIVDSQEAFYQCMIGIGHGYFTSVWNKCFRKDKIIQSGVKFDEECSIAEDELWLSQLFQSISNVSLTKKMLYHWRQRNSSALHRNSIDRRWLQALETKKCIADLWSQNPKYRSLAYGKVYTDLCQCIWNAHCLKQYDMESYFRTKLKKYKLFYYLCREYSIKQKIRFLLLDLMCILNFPESLIVKLNNMTSAKLIRRIGM